MRDLIHSSSMYNIDYNFVKMILSIFFYIFGYAVIMRPLLNNFLANLH